MQKWEEYNASLRSTATASTIAPNGATAAAAAALRSWSYISKPARQALRKANVHSVLALETQLLDLLEQVRVCGGPMEGGRSWTAAGSRKHRSRTGN